MATPLNTIKNWFKTGLKPTQAQFWATFDSFWHKEETIPQANIENLQASFDAKLDKTAIKPLVIVNGNLFELQKHVANNLPANAQTIEVNDIIANGWWDGTEFWQAAMYLGGDINLKLSWTALSRIEEIPII